MQNKTLAGKFDIFIGLTALCAFGLLLLENSAYLKPYSNIVGEINLAIGLIFILDVLLRFFASPDKKKHLLRNWFDLIVFIPFIQLTQGIENTPFFVVIRQLVVLVMFLSRVRKSTKLVNLLSLKPAQMMVATFAFAIGAGAILLMLPAATRAGVKTPLVDALFTATSATCVTGLAIRDTGAYFSVFGQMVILALIQIGGLGIMTFSISLALMLKKRLDMKHEAIMSDVLDQASLASVKSLVLYIFKMTAVFELLGATMLFAAWVGKTGGALKTAYYAFFHSVSAFCNAGFSTFSDNLTGFQDDIPTNMTVCALIVLGGLGFMVIKDLQEYIRNRSSLSEKRKMPLKVQTKIVLLSSFLLVVSGAAAIFIFERDNSFSGLSLKAKVLASLFQSVTARTAGFNSCDVARLSLPSLFLMIGLMFIGGSPGSTAGGVKTTTFSVLWATITAELKGKNFVEMFKRTIPQDVVKKAAIIFFVSCLIVGSFLVALLLVEKKVFIDVMFETVSAFGTVGLSMGLTPALSSAGKLIITLLMFIGRLGPLTIGYALLRRRKQPRYEYAQETVAIG